MTQRPTHSGTAIRSRDQLIVGALAMQLKDLPLKALRSRARALPSMFQRHGPLQVFLFLAAKEPSDRAVGEVVWRVLRSLNPRSPLATMELYGPSQQPHAALKTLFEAVAGADIEQRLHDQALCIEIASWLARTIDASCELDQEEQEQKAAYAAPKDGMSDGK